MLEDAVSGQAFSVDRGIAGLVMRTEDALSVPVAAKHRAFDYEVDCGGGGGRGGGYPCGAEEPLVPLLAVPIARQRGRASGVVLVWGSQHKTAFGPDDVTLLQIVARQCAVVEAHATEKLEQELLQARVDPSLVHRPIPRRL
jgi:signal transduction protein with GAF and PtsI domain